MPGLTSDTNDVQKAVESIAIVGAACRFSGIASNQDGLWQMLSKGMTSWSRGTQRRFKLDAFWHPEAPLSGSVNSRGVHLLGQDPAVFDNDFFGISGVEAKAIDPQHRLMLEVAYETFENAGLSITQLEGSKTGVYCAVSYMDYDLIQGRDPEVSPTYRFTGTGPSLLANRISYVFDLRGPSMAVDTACSSTLVAIHEACRALRDGDVDQILVGGTNLILDPEKLTVISSMQFLSGHGRCYSFDSRASGYGRGEGVAAVLLKPLHAAIRDGDTIRGVIRGSATGSDGKTPGITMPSPSAQYDTIMRAYKLAGLDPSETLYVEAHGTGTNAGDNCETTAFSRAFCKTNDRKLMVGSVKSNLGHTECVSGLAGLIKALLMLERGVIVPNPTLETPNPVLDLDTRGIEVASQLQQWPTDTIRRASVNGSGYGGTNAHIILEAWPQKLPSGSGLCEIGNGLSCNGGNNGHSEAETLVFVWSHRGGDDLTKLASIWKRFLMRVQANSESLPLKSLAFTLSSKRSTFAYRASITATNIRELVDGVSQIASVSSRPIKALTDPKVCFIFTGQGAQWAQMGIDLLPKYPVFAQSMNEIQTHLLEFGCDWHLIEELKKSVECTRINEPELAQPCCTAIQIALVDLLESWGVKPDFVCGHSSGEIAAAYAAGALNAADAIKVAYYRGKAVQHLKEIAPELRGAMLAVGLSQTDAENHIQAYRDRVTVACINSPSSVTLSGDADAIDELALVFEDAKVFCRKLIVNVAYHSHHMAIVENYYQSAIEGIRPCQPSPTVRMVSSVTGNDACEQELDSCYWTKNLVSPVRFSDALSKVLSLTEGNNKSSPTGLIIELGPHSALKGPVLQDLKASAVQHSISYVSCLLRNEDGVNSSLSMASEIFKRGAPIDLNRVNNISNKDMKVLTNLPGYNWNHNNVHWNESRRSMAYRLRKSPRHELIGTAASDSISSEPWWHHYIRLSEMPWVKGHCIDGQIVFAAAGYISMATEALKEITADQGWKKKVVHLKHVSIDRPLIIQDDDSFGAEVFIAFRPYSYSSRQSSSKWNEFRIFSATQDGQSTEHCRGLIALIDRKDQLALELEKHLNHDNKDMDLNSWVNMESQKMYRGLRTLSMNYSGCFASLQSILARPWVSNCSLVVPDTKSTMPSGHQQPHFLHPTTLEGCLQACLPGIKLGGHLNQSQVIIRIDDLYVSTDIAMNPGDELRVQTQSGAHGLKQCWADILVTYLHKGNDVEICIKGVKFSPSQGQGSIQNSGEEALCHRIEWALDPLTSPKDSVLDYCRKEIVSETKNLRKHCDPFCRKIIGDTLSQLTPDELVSNSSHLGLFIKWMQSQEVSERESTEMVLSEDLNSIGAPGEMLIRLSERLPEILRGTIEPLSVLLKNELLYKVYSEDHCLNRCHTQLVEYLKLLQFKIPNMRILEIGGGTGSLTLPVAHALYGDQRRHSVSKGSFVFTDVSTSFLTTMEEKLKEYGQSIEFARFDIEQPAARQGLKLGSFDIIIASNVVHVSRDLNHTLSNLKTLLKPGGHIAFAETTSPSLRWGMTFGILPGWWLGVDDGRLNSPLLQAPQWDDVLKKSGFSGVSLEMRDSDDDDEHEVSLIISSVPLPMPENPESHITILADNHASKISIEVMNSLTHQFPGIEISISTLFETPPQCGTLIFLLETTTDFLLSPSTDGWEKFRDLVCGAQNVLWVTRGGTLTCEEPQRALVTGLGRSLRAENHELKFFSLDVDQSVLDEEISSYVSQVYKQVMSSQASPQSTSEWELTAQGGAISIPRLLVDHTVDDWVKDTVSPYHPQKVNITDSTRALGLRIQSPGILDTLYWADDPMHSQPPSSSQIKVKIENIALNFKDLMTAMGQLDGLSTILIEGSGTVVELGDSATSNFAVGDRVCVFGPGGLATTSNIDMRHACLVPGI